MLAKPLPLYPLGTLLPVPQALRMKHGAIAHTLCLDVTMNDIQEVFKTIHSSLS